MPRGFDQPTSSSASRTADTGSREQPAQRSAVRTRQGRYEVSAPIEGVSELKEPPSGRRPTNPPSRDISQRSREPQARTSPAYLQGKNPYGQVLSSVEHPYQEIEATASTTVGQPSQNSISVQGKPRGSAQDTAPQITLVEPESERTTKTSHPRLSPLPHRQPSTTGTVIAAKKFFETKSSQSQSAPLPLASTTLTDTGVTVSDPHPSVRSPSRPKRLSSAVEEQAQKTGISDTALRPSSPPLNIQQNEAAQLTNTPKLPKAGKSIPGVVVRRATTQHVNSLVTHEYSQGEEQTGRRRSTNIFADEVHTATPPHLEQQSTTDVAISSAIGKLHRIEPRGSSEETVRRHRSSSLITELKGLDGSETKKLHGKTQRSKSAHEDHRTLGEQNSTSTQRFRRQNSRSAPLAEGFTHREQALQRADRRLFESSVTDTSPSQHYTATPSIVRQKVEAIAARGLSHDGSGSLHDLSQHSASSLPIAVADIGVQEDYHNTEVPHHVDWRGAYGRRKTQDFGFPGARIKPRSSPRSYRPLQDPSNWVKRACGHFSYMGKGEAPELASRKGCRQCRGKAIPAVMPPQPARHRRNRKQVTTDTSTSSSSSSSNSSKSFGARKSRRRQHHSDCVPDEKCGDTFAKDLGFIIDAILEEHTTTLRGVIDNIKRSQPSLAQLRRVSQDLVQRSQSPGACTNARHRQCCPPCTQQIPCQKVCQPACKPQVCEWTPSCPYVPPKATEKLNVGSPGQLVPNMNDSRASLRESVKSIPELVELVNSAADDLGLDLDRRPTTKDDRMFQDAPYEKTPRDSIPSRHSDPLDIADEGSTKKDQYAEDPWLQQTRRHLTELSEARTQLMDELDSIAEDLGVQLQDRRSSEVRLDPIQRVLSRVNTGFSRRSTRLRNKSVDSVAEEIPKMIEQHTNERRLSRVLTRISSQSRRMSAITQNMQEIGEIPPEEIQEWLEVAQTQLPAAIDSITTVLETLPALDFESSDELEEQPQFEQQYGSQDYPGPESGYEEDEPELYEDYAESPPRRTYTEPISDLQDRITDLERRLRKESIRVISPELYEDDDEFAEEKEILPVQSVAAKQPMYPSARSFSPQRQAESERSVSIGRNDIEEVVAEHSSARRTSTIKATHSDIHPERTFSFVSSESSEPEEPMYAAPTELIGTSIDEPWRRPTRRRTSMVQSPVQIPISSKTVPQHESADNSSMVSSIMSSARSEDGKMAASSRRTTRQSTRKASAPDDEFEPPKIRMARSITRPVEEQPLLDIETAPEVPVLVAAKSMARESRRPTIRSPSPILEETIEELPLLRTDTRYPTRQPTRRSVVDVVIEAPDDTSNGPTRRVRKIATQPPPPTPEPEPEEVIRETTRRNSEPLEEPPAPPSSPSTEAEVMLPSRTITPREVQSMFIEEEEEEPLKMSTRTIHLTLRPEDLPSELLQRLSPSVASEVSLERAIEEDPKSEEVMTPAHELRRLGTMQEPLVEETRKLSVRSSPSMIRLLTGPTRHSTVAERRATFEDASKNSRRTTIMSDPTTADTSSEQPPLLSRTSTQYVSRKPTRRTTEPEHIRLPVSRQSTMLNVDAPPRRASTYELAGSTQRNFEESELEVKSSITRQSTRRNISDKARSPSVSRRITMRSSRSVSRSASAYSLSERSQRNAEVYPDNREAKPSRVGTQQPTKVARNPTRRVTERSFKEPQVITRRGTRQKTMPTELDLDLISNNREMSPVPIERNKQVIDHAASRQLTQIQTEGKSSTETEANFSSSSSSLGSQPVSYQAATDRDRKMTTVERNDTLPRERQEDTGRKISTIPREPTQRLEKRRSGHTENSLTDPTIEVPELIDETVRFPSESDSDIGSETHSHTSIRPGTLDLRTDSQAIPLRKTSVLEEESPPMTMSRNATTLSRRATGQPPYVQLEEVPMVGARKHTTISRKSTQVPIDLPVSAKIGPPTGHERVPTHLSRRSTRAPTVLIQPTVQQNVEPDDELEQTGERGSRTSSTQSLLLEEPFTAGRVLSVKYTDPSPEEPSPVVKRKITVPETAGSYPLFPPSDPPSQQPIIAVSQPDTLGTDTDHSSETPLVGKTAAEETPEEEPSRSDRLDLSRDPEPLASPLPKSLVKAPTAYSPPLERRQTRIDPKVDERVPRVLTVARERDRRRSSAVPEIVASPPETYEAESQPDHPARKSKKVHKYPPEQQYPRAPAYPSRETPSWTRPDTRTPPPKPRAENPPKKHRFRGWGSKPKDEPVQRPPEPFRDRDAVEPFRHAAPGPVPGPPGGALQRPRGYANRPGNTAYYRSPAPIPIRRDDYPSRQAPIYARKDDYYPRLTPVIRDRRDEYNRPQPAPIHREIYPQYPRAQAPARRDYPAPARREYPAPNYAPPRDYPQTRPRARSAAPYRSEPRQQPLRRYTPEPARREPQAQQAARDQEKAPTRTKTPISQRRPQAHEEPSRTRTTPQNEDLNRPTRRDARHPTPNKDAATRKAAGSSRSGTSPAADHKTPRIPQKKGEPGGREEPGLPARRQDTREKPSKLPEDPAQKPHRQAPEREQQLPSRGVGPSGAESEEEADSGEDSGNGSITQSSQDEESTSIRDSVDGASGRPSLEIQRGSFATGTDFSQARTKPASNATRRTPNQGHQRRPSSTRPEEEKPIRRAISPQAVAIQQNGKTADKLAKSAPEPKTSVRPRPTATETETHNSSDPNAAIRPRIGGKNSFGAQRAPEPAKRTPSFFRRGKAHAESVPAQNAGQGTGEGPGAAKGQFRGKEEAAADQGSKGNPPKGKWGWGRGWGRG